ncbi:MAG: hemin uptake protein HemP [Gallionella sp.]|nr:hemin uptake protein HemP [Hydrogenophaga sp.]MDZ4201212.1 hemin uptake protein HemP [Gallionella sp.]
MNPLDNEEAGLGPAAQPKPQNPLARTALPSQDLLRGEKTVSIEHNGTVYRLQSTRAGKLILTK